MNTDALIYPECVLNALDSEMNALPQPEACALEEGVMSGLYEYAHTGCAERLLMAAAASLALFGAVQAHVAIAPATVPTAV